MINSGAGTRPDIGRREPGSAADRLNDACRERLPGSWFARAWIDVKGWAKMPSIPDRTLAEICTQQARGMALLCPVLSLAGLNTLGALVFGLPGGVVAWPARTLAVITALVYAGVLVEVWRYRRRIDRQSLARRFIGQMTLLVLALAICWCGISMLIAFGGGRAERNLLFGVDIGLVSSAALLMPRRLAFAFWIPATFGGLASSAAVDSGAPTLVSTTFLAYAMVIAFSILVGNRALVVRTVSQIRLEEQGEVIQLLLRDFERNASDWLWETDRRLRLTHVSERLVGVTAMSAELLLGLSLRTLLFGLTRGSDGEAKSATEILRSLDAREPIYAQEIRVRIADEERHWTITCQPVFDRRGEFQGYRGVGSDVTGEKVSAREIAYLAGHDMLTALPNRRLAAERLAAACLGATHAPFALLCIDLDGFKEINDRFGHSGGDSLLVVVAQRLRESTRQNDLVARLGGDEFAILLRTAETDEIIAVIRRLLALLAAPIHIQGVQIQIGASIGVARAPEDGIVADALLHRADLALYRAKDAGRGTSRFFLAAMATDQAACHTLEEELREAFAAGAFRVEYEPIVDLRSGQLAGAEAQVRWAHPTRGTLALQDFVPSVKYGATLLELGAWTLRRAAQDAASWPRHLRVAVSLSAAQLGDEALSLAVEQSLAASGLLPSRLDLQIPGAVFPAAGGPIWETLAGLRRTGVRIVLDDFAGQSPSLFRLREFPFDRIRVSVAPRGGTCSDGLEAAIFRSVIGLCGDAGIDVVANDVSDQLRLDQLRAQGCNFAQGALIGASCSTDAFYRATLGQCGL